jgi:hypothetical protein
MAGDSPLGSWPYHINTGGYTCAQCFTWVINGTTHFCVPQPPKAPCPSCGYCPTCGRKNA